MAPIAEATAMKATNGVSIRGTAAASTGLVMVLSAGCDMGERGFGGIGYTGHKRQIMCPVGEIKPEAAVVLGRRVLASHGFRVKSADVDDMSIETFPSEKTVRGGEGRLRDAVVKLPNRVRRTASLEFSSRGGDLQAWCQVKLERLTTADHRVFDHQRRFDDAPTQTPIEREGATTAQQNTVWSSAGRDETLERQILADLRQRIQQTRKAPPSEQ
jgi:hypothetical protein